MDLIEAICAHRSIRTYRPDPVPEADLETILHAAARASTSGNMQTYSIIVTEDPRRREALWHAHLRQDMILQAPVLLTFCVDWRRMILWCRQSGADPGYDNFHSFLIGFADALIAAQNAALASEALGYGICYLGTTLNAVDPLIELLGLPQGVFPATTLVLGVPGEDPALRARLPQDSIVHRETYQDFDAERIEATYRARETEGWERYQRFPRLARAMATSGVRNLAQVYTQLKYTRPRFVRTSLELLAALEAQGFFEHDVEPRHPPPP